MEPELDPADPLYFEKLLERCLEAVALLLFLEATGQWRACGDDRAEQGLARVAAQAIADLWHPLRHQRALPRLMLRRMSCELE